MFHRYFHIGKANWWNSGFLSHISKITHVVMVCNSYSEKYENIYWNSNRTTSMVPSWHAAAMGQRVRRYQWGRERIQRLKWCIVPYSMTYRIPRSFHLYELAYHCAARQLRTSQRCSCEGQSWDLQEKFHRWWSRHIFFPCTTYHDMCATTTNKFLATLIQLTNNSSQTMAPTSPTKSTIVIAVPSTSYHTTLSSTR